MESSKARTPHLFLQASGAHPVIEQNFCNTSVIRSKMFSVGLKNKWKGRVYNFVKGTFRRKVEICIERQRRREQR